MKQIKYTIESELILDENRQLIRGEFNEYVLRGNGYLIMRTSINWLAEEAKKALERTPFSKQKAILILEYGIENVKEFFKLEEKCLK